MNLRAQEGYTLIETLIAMVLFVGVLLPLLGAMSDLMIDKAPDERASALKMAEEEFSILAQEEPISSAERMGEHAFSVKREVAEHGGLLEVTVSVYSNKAQDKPILTIHRSIAKAR